jgi:integrator complex subunit 11
MYLSLCSSVYSLEDIKVCLKQVTTLGLHETFTINDSLKITFYYAGHVIGAVMVHLEYHGQSVLYTGDFNTVPSTNLRGASVPRLNPDLLITESTYAMKHRSGNSEYELLTLLRRAVERGGKVLLPVSSLNAQEFCMLLEMYWKRYNLTAPIYVSSEMASQSNSIHRLFPSWFNATAGETRYDELLKASKYITRWDNANIHKSESCVLLASPGTVHSGLSAHVCQAWIKDELNMVIFTVSAAVVLALPMFLCRH